AKGASLAHALFVGSSAAFDQNNITSTQQRTSVGTARGSRRAVAARRRNALGRGPMTIRKRRKIPPPEPIAGNGLLDRRMLLGRGIMFAGAMGTGAAGSLTGAGAEPLKNDPWSLEMGSVVPAYQVPSRFEKDVVRSRSNPNNEFRNSHARTPHHLLQGTVTPNGLFFS